MKEFNNDEFDVYDIFFPSVILILISCVLFIFSNELTQNILVYFLLLVSGFCFYMLFNGVQTLNQKKNTVTEHDTFVKENENK